MVEDNPCLAQLIGENLTNDGHQIDSVGNGYGCRQMLGAGRDYHLILLDSLLPDGAGEALGRELRAEGVTAPILLFNGKEALQHCRGETVPAVDTFLAPLRELIRQELAPHLRPEKSNVLVEVLGDIRKVLRQAEAGESPMGAEPPEIFQAAVHVGQGRLSRRSLEMITSGFIAGMNVTFGALAAAVTTGAFQPLLGSGADVVGAVFFPIGFIFLAIGKSELFTENFLVPITAVLAGKGKLRQILRLWALTLAGNLLGALLFSFLLSRSPQIVGPAATQHMLELARSKVDGDFTSTVLSGLFGGWLITLMTWLIIASRGTTAKIVIIWCVGFLISLNGFNHVVVNSTEIFFSINRGSGITYGNWFVNFFIPTTLGNMIGGTVFVTMFQYLQVLKIEEIFRRPRQYLGDRGADLASTEDTL